MYKKLLTLGTVFAMLSLFALTGVIDANAGIIREARGSEGGTVGPDGTCSCPGIPLYVCARSESNVYMHPYYSDRLDLLNVSGGVTATFQGRFLYQLSPSAFVFEIM